MIRYGIIAATCLLLGGCATFAPKPNIIEKQYVVAKPSNSMYKCNRPGMPDPATLTDRQVAKLLRDLVAANEECAASLRAIKAFEENADGSLNITAQRVGQLRAANAR